MDVVTLTDSNYSGYLNLDALAFSFASPGAMGDGGGICIIDKDGKIYYANFCFGDELIKLEAVEKAIPVIKECKFGALGALVPSGWVSFYLGFGNHLVMSTEIADDFRQKITEANLQNRGDLFQRWPGFILGIIGKGDDNIKVSDIWCQIYHK
ncbi:MAG: hypothetical protein ILA25_06220 [Prevotella sp.]|nr:hypothetical protein [Prevotella sp.]